MAISELLTNNPALFDLISKTFGVSIIVILILLLLFLKSVTIFAELSVHPSKTMINSFSC
jgi:hypothetical protein